MIDTGTGASCLASPFSNDGVSCNVWHWWRVNKGGAWTSKDLRQEAQRRQGVGGLRQTVMRLVVAMLSLSPGLSIRVRRRCAVDAGSVGGWAFLGAPQLLP